MSETHATRWGLWLLKRRGTVTPSPPIDGTCLGGVTDLEVATMLREGLLPGQSACKPGSWNPHLTCVSYPLIITQIPTCPLCAVMRDEVLENRP